MKTLLPKLQRDFKDFSFVVGSSFYWSAEYKQIIYRETNSDNSVAIWSLLHELAHGVLGHANYDSDFELLQLEVAAWEKAKLLGKQYGYRIDLNHIQDCLDTYRDWLYQRSTCPDCTNCSLQQNSTTYKCFNCGMCWRVSSSRLCRPYRLGSSHLS